jgi:hypothetical protein
MRRDPPCRSRKLTWQNENIQAFVQAQKKTYGKCLYGHLKCDGKSIDAHSIQNANVLELRREAGA